MMSFPSPVRTVFRARAVPPPSAGAGGGGTLKIVPYVVHRLSFGQVQEENVPGLYDGPFPWENLFGFHLAGMVGHDFFKRYAVTFDFENMRIVLQ